MAQDFGQYIGVDVSPEMVRMAASYAFPRTTFQPVSGGDLNCIPGASVDFAFSFGVFQHLPEKAAILNYFTEIERVLRPGGIFRLQMKGLWALQFGQFALEAGLSNPAGRAASDSPLCACGTSTPGKAAPSPRAPPCERARLTA